MPLVRQYLVLYSGDVHLMRANYWVDDIENKEQYLNSTLDAQLKYYPKDLRETASHIELEIDMGERHGKK